MKKLLFLLSLVAIFSLGCIQSPGGRQSKNIDAIVDKMMEDESSALEQRKDELKEELKSMYCEENSDCIKVGAPCSGAKAFNKNAEEAIMVQAEFTKNYKGACTMEIKEFGEPYCKDNLCTVDRI
ncbi:hypothetical protein HOB10_02605 [Candidatus Parcubacteria bacterium]|jgi:hypothetical protein|nr:hypothetical protein [Candidatus Parcubacteria bacterium]